MGRKTKDSVPINLKLDKKVSEKLNKICEETGLTKTAVLENAVEHFFDYYSKTGKVN